MKYFLTCLTLLLLLSSCTSSSSSGVPVFIQFDTSCEYEELIPGEVTSEIKNTNFIIIGTTATIEQIHELDLNECVIRSFRPSELQTVLKDLQADFDEEADKELEKRTLSRTVEREDIPNREELLEYLKEKHKQDPRITQEDEDVKGEVLSEYQLYVTPDAESVQDLADNLDGIQEIYDEALSWVWVSEEYLNGVKEYWYYPEEFLTETPENSNNPSPGTPASDCEEQANTLVSLLIADGYEPENVRVVLGEVNFNGQRGGHAWVEIYEDGHWIPLEATAGAYYDDETDTLYAATSISYDYFEYHRYPVIDVWYYYNNEYYLDMTEGTPQGTAPEHWEEEYKSWLAEDLERTNAEPERGPRGVSQRR